MKWFNVAKDGTIFINTAKTLGKAAKQTKNPPIAIGLAVAAVVAAVFAAGVSLGQRGK